MYLPKPTEAHAQAHDAHQYRYYSIPPSDAPIYIPLTSTLMKSVPMPMLLLRMLMCLMMLIIN